MAPNRTEYTPQIARSVISDSSFEPSSPTYARIRLSQTIQSITLPTVAPRLGTATCWSSRPCNVQAPHLRIEDDPGRAYSAGLLSSGSRRLRCVFLILMAHGASFLDMRPFQLRTSREPTVITHLFVLYPIWNEDLLMPRPSLNLHPFSLLYLSNTLTLQLFLVSSPPQHVSDLKGLINVCLTRWIQGYRYRCFYRAGEIQYLTYLCILC